jgi:hypothetical protein
MPFFYIAPGKSNRLLVVIILKETIACLFYLTSMYTYKIPRVAADDNRRSYYASVYSKIMSVWGIENMALHFRWFYLSIMIYYWFIHLFIYLLFIHFFHAHFNHCVVNKIGNKGYMYKWETFRKQILWYMMLSALFSCFLKDFFCSFVLFFINSKL